MRKRRSIPFGKAKDYLPTSSRIHTFRQSGVMLIGADWSKAQILRAIKKYGCEQAGPQATAMHHGLVLFDGKGALFIETQEGAFA